VLEERPIGDIPAPVPEGVAHLKGIAANLESLKKESKTTGSSEGDFADKV
jgi:hypothetical protein